MFENPLTMKLAAFVSGLVFFFVLESGFGFRPWVRARWKRIGTHLSFAAFNTVVLKFVFAGSLLWWCQKVHDNGWGLTSFFGLSGVYAVVFCAVAMDYFDYWWHRLNHRIPFLWRFHSVHHMDDHVDVTTSLRFHVGELAISNLVKFSWLLIIGPDVWSFVIFEVLITAASQFHHTNIDLGRFEKFVTKFWVTPRYHSSHHTIDQLTGNANYSTLLNCWDVIHRTFGDYSNRRLGDFGVPTDQGNCNSFFDSVKAPFVKSPENEPAFVETSKI